MSVLGLATLGVLLLGIAAMWARDEIRRLRRDWTELINEEMAWYVFLGQEPFIWQIIVLVALATGGVVCLYKAASAIADVP